MKIIGYVWRQPLFVSFQNGIKRRFSDCYEALDFLEHEWPIRRGSAYAAAIDACRSALGRRLSTEIARDAFVLACQEASLLVQRPDVGYDSPRPRAA